MATIRSSNMLRIMGVALLGALAVGCEFTPPKATAQQVESTQEAEEDAMNEKAYPVQKTEEEWREILTEEQYNVLRKGGTECSFTGELCNDHREGVYHCAACGNPLFSSETKFESGTGWPSYFQPVGPDRVEEHVDRSHGMVRTEVVCGRCGSHLGHVFQDGPKPTGLRFCINSVALEWKPELVEPE